MWDPPRGSEGPNAHPIAVPLQRTLARNFLRLFIRQSLQDVGRINPSGLSGPGSVWWVAMTHGSFLSVAATLTILAAVVVLAGLSLLVLGMDGIPERRAVALFWGALR